MSCYVYTSGAHVSQIEDFTAETTPVKIPRLSYFWKSYQPTSENMVFFLSYQPTIFGYF